MWSWKDHHRSVFMFLYQMRWWSYSFSNLITHKRKLFSFVFCYGPWQLVFSPTLSTVFVICVNKSNPCFLCSFSLFLFFFQSMHEVWDKPDLGVRTSDRRKWPMKTKIYCYNNFRMKSTRTSNVGFFSLFWVTGRFFHDDSFVDVYACLPLVKHCFDDRTRWFSSLSNENVSLKRFLLCFLLPFMFETNLIHRVMLPIRFCTVPFVIWSC